MRKQYFINCLFCFTSATSIKRMMKGNARLLFAVFLLLTGPESYCSDSTRIFIKKNVAFVSFGTKENVGSVNYERIFSTAKKFYWSCSIGVQPFEPSKKFSVPVSVNMFTKGRLHHLELDLAITFYMDKYHPYNGGLKDDFNKQLFVTPFVCYRLQGSKGFIFKCGAGPQVLFDPPSDDVLKFKTKLQASTFGAVGISF